MPRSRRKRRQPMAEKKDDSFELYDLRVEVVAPEGGPIYCGAKVGDYFELRGEMLYLPPGQGISIYSLASVLPLLAAKQRPTHKNDWMTADAGITTFDCADIYTGVEELIGRFRQRYRELRGSDALGSIKVHTKFVPDL